MKNKICYKLSIRTLTNKVFFGQRNLEYVFFFLQQNKPRLIMKSKICMCSIFLFYDCESEYISCDYLVYRLLSFVDTLGKIVIYSFLAVAKSGWHSQAVKKRSSEPWQIYERRMIIINVQMRQEVHQHYDKLPPLNSKLFILLPVGLDTIFLPNVLSSTGVFALLSALLCFFPRSWAMVFGSMR